MAAGTRCRPHPTTSRNFFRCTIDLGGRAETVQGLLAGVLPPTFTQPREKPMPLQPPCPRCQDNPRSHTQPHPMLCTSCKHNLNGSAQQPVCHMPQCTYKGHMPYWVEGIGNICNACFKGLDVSVKMGDRPKTQCMNCHKVGVVGQDLKNLISPEGGENLGPICADCFEYKNNACHGCDEQMGARYVHQASGWWYCEICAKTLKGHFVRITINRPKPPLGVMPRRIWQEQRVAELVGAIGRYALAGKDAPPEWMWEINVIVRAMQIEADGKF